MSVVSPPHPGSASRAAAISVEVSSVMLITLPVVGVLVKPPGRACPLGSAAMQVRELLVPGAFEFTPVQHGDDRGLFLEWFKIEKLVEAVGHPLTLAQANLSVSRAATLRGVHFADVPPGQAKYVTCPRGAVLDYMVDIRVGSPTFGAVDAVRLDSEH